MRPAPLLYFLVCCSCARAQALADISIEPVVRAHEALDDCLDDDMRTPVSLQRCANEDHRYHRRLSEYTRSCERKCYNKMKCMDKCLTPLQEAIDAHDESTGRRLSIELEGLAVPQPDDDGIIRLDNDPLGWSSPLGSADTVRGSPLYELEVEDDEGTWRR